MITTKNINYDMITTITNLVKVKPRQNQFGRIMHRPYVRSSTSVISQSIARDIKDIVAALEKIMEICNFVRLGKFKFRFAEISLEKIYALIEKEELWQS